MATIKKMSTINMDKARSYERYTENLSGWARLPEDDPIITSYFDEIEDNLNGL